MTKENGIAEITEMGYVFSDQRSPFPRDDAVKRGIRPPKLNLLSKHYHMASDWPRYGSMKLSKWIY